MTMDVLATLRKPVVTEKSTLLGEQNKYVFEVIQRANKPQVKEAVERAFGVKVLSVNMIKTKGEHRRVGSNRRVVKTPDVKKAVVTLRQGDTIQIFEGA
jgi:large subunit ribosomal protein L23